MTVAGLQKMTLLDYPGKVACTVFLSGCNFRCPFCHNGELLDGGEEIMDEAALAAFLESRKGLLDAVCVTGGEPTLAPDIESLFEMIKKAGFLAKLDTNGSRPDVLERLINAGLVDYVAMDIKNSPQLYDATAGVKGMKLDGIEKSIRLLAKGSVDYEFRTTVVAELHSRESVQDMGEWLAQLAAPGRVKRIFLQQFVDRESVLFAGLHAPSEAEIRGFADVLRPFADLVEVRGV